MLGVFLCLTATQVSSPAVPSEFYKSTLGTYKLSQPQDVVGFTPTTTILVCARARCSSVEFYTNIT